MTARHRHQRPQRRSRRTDRRRRDCRRHLVAVAALIGAVAAAIAAVRLLDDTTGTNVRARPLPEQEFALTPNEAAALPDASPRCRTGPTKESTSASRPTKESTSASVARSGSVVIPSLCLSVPLEPVYVDPLTWELDVPADVRRAGLNVATHGLGAALTDGTGRAGTAGTTLIAGHVDAADQGPGAFYTLHQIGAGATVDVVDASGRWTQWKVYAVHTVAKDALPTDLYDAAGQRRLVLVTCGGPLRRDESGASYADNVLVYATPVGAAEQRS